MWSFLVPFFTETPEAPLILPDSVQKANLAEAVNKIIHLDVGDMLRSLLSESVWILVKILIALAIYFIGRWIVRRIVRLLDAAFERRQVDTSLRSFLRNTVKVVFTLILLMIVVQTLGVVEGQLPDRDFDVHRRRGHCAGGRLYQNLCAYGRQGGHQPQGGA